MIHKVGQSITSLTGEVAHIVGETRNAARGDSNLSDVQRNAPENLLLLCREHHKIVDDDPSTYTVDVLSTAKHAHIEDIVRALTVLRPWNSSISQLVYINVPRLLELAEFASIEADVRKYAAVRALHDLSFELNYVMAAFKGVLETIPLKTISLERLELHEGLIGTPISFDRQRFRTKNIRQDRGRSFANFSGDLAKDPHIYAPIKDLRLVLNVDPRWITTSTAFTLFRSSAGQSVFSGSGRITNIDYETGIVTVTPWVIGVPKGIFDDISAAPTQPDRSNVNENKGLETLVDLPRAIKKPSYWMGEIESCDICGRAMKDEEYMVDCGLKGSRGWACMCATCFAKHGVGIGWGRGQLYMRDNNGWLLVAGFPLSSDD